MNIQNILNGMGIRNKVAPYITDSHLDYGCGDGVFTRGLSVQGGIMVGYDPSTEEIQKARKISWSDNVVFTESQEYVRLLSYAPFRSASFLFGFHNVDDTIFTEMYDFLSEGSKLCVIDYHLKGKNPWEFYKLFSAEKERKEFWEMKPWRAFKVHTAKDLGDCVRAGEKAGFETEHGETFDNKYFLWVGRKQSQ